MPACAQLTNAVLEPLPNPLMDVMSGNSVSSIHRLVMDPETAGSHEAGVPCGIAPLLP